MNIKINSRLFRTIFFSLGLYLIFLFLLAPAQSFIWLLSKPLPNVTATDLQGSFIRGEAGAFFWQSNRLGSLSWYLSPLAWLQGGIGWQWQIHHPQQQHGLLEGETGYRINSDRYGNLTVKEWPLADWVNLLEEIPLPVALTGAMAKGNIQFLIRHGSFKELAGAADIKDLALISPSIVLGDFRITAHLDGKDKSKVQLLLESQKAVITLKGSIVLTTQRHYQVSLAVTPQENTPKLLLQLLPQVGTFSTTDRTYKIAQEGTF